MCTILFTVCVNLLYVLFDVLYQATIKMINRANFSVLNISYGGHFDNVMCFASTELSQDFFLLV